VINAETSSTARLHCCARYWVISREIRPIIKHIQTLETIPDTADAAALMPLTVNEGLTSESAEYLASRFALYSRVLARQLPAPTTHRHLRHGDALGDQRSRRTMRSNCGTANDADVSCPRTFGGA